jgi:hypothetical protein
MIGLGVDAPLRDGSSVAYLELQYIRIRKECGGKG